MLAEGCCLSCGRFGGRHRHCPWCGEDIFRRVPLLRARLISLLALGLCLLLPVFFSRPVPAPFAAAFFDGTRLSGAATCPLPSLALPAPRGTPDSPVFGPSSLIGFPGLSRSVFWLAPLALAGAVLALWLPALHPFSLAALAILWLRDHGGAADWSFALACLLAAWTGLGAWSLAAGDHRGRGPGSVWRVSFLLLGGLLSAGLALRWLRLAGLLFAPALAMGAALLLLALLGRGAAGPGERAPLPRPLLSHAGLIGDRLLVAVVAGVLAWSGARVAGDAAFEWSPHALSLVLFGFWFARGDHRDAVAGEKAGASASLHLALAGAANLLAPVATGDVARSLSGWRRQGSGKVSRSAGRAGFHAVVPAGFLAACFGGLGVPAGGGAWLAEAAGLPQQSGIAAAAFYGTVAGLSFAWLLARAGRSSRRRWRWPAACSGMGEAPRWLSLAAAVALALATLGLPGLILLALAWLAGRLPVLLALDAAPLAALALLPLALGLPGVAAPFPAWLGWLP